MTGPVPDVWDQAVAAGEGMFATALALSELPPPVTDRERALVDLALQSGVLGAISVVRGEP